MRLAEWSSATHAAGRRPPAPIARREPTCRPSPPLSSALRTIATDCPEAWSSHTAMNVLERLRAAFAAATPEGGDPQAFGAAVRATNDPKFGDYQANGCMALGKSRKVNPARPGLAGRRRGGSGAAGRPARDRRPWVPQRPAARRLDLAEPGRTARRRVSPGSRRPRSRARSSSTSRRPTSPSRCTWATSARRSSATAWPGSSRPWAIGSSATTTWETGARSSA